MALGTGDLVRSDLRSTSSGQVGVLTFNRPEQRNPLDRHTVAELNDRLDALIADESVRAVIVTGAPPAFSAGGDLRGYLDLYQDEAAFRAFLEAIRSAFDKLERSRLVSIAAVNGVCVAGGFELALACDLIVVARGARLGDGHLKFWQLPGGGGTQRLPRAVGFSAAKRLLYTHELVGAEEALAMGLATAIHEPEELLDRAVELAERVTGAPEDAITTLKRLLRHAADDPLDDGLAEEIDQVAGYTSGVESSGYQGLLRFLER